MTITEFLSLIQSRGAKVFPAFAQADVIITNTNLQDIRAAMLPSFMMELYAQCGGITLGSSCIFGPKEIERGIKYPLPSIAKINKDMIRNKNLFGKTVFGHNDLFWFAFDTSGKCLMLDNLTLSVLRQYNEPYRAMIDCLIIGKI